MSTSARQLARAITRPVKKLQKPRPLKPTTLSRHSAIDATNLSVFDEIMVLAEAVASNISNGNFDRNLQSNIASLSGLLKNYGRSLEMIYKDQLDRTFFIFRNGCRDENLDYTSRLLLLELIELRAMHWTTADGTSYYKHKYNHTDVDLLSISSLDSSIGSASAFQNAQLLNAVSAAAAAAAAPPSPPQPLLLGPTEVVKSSGTFPAPTKIPGRNYYNDEVVIRNSDSGKVMGIKGKRVHMIEELSKTVISFQRVSPSAKERLVQIMGPSEDKIIYAKQLMEETIKRNASPVRVDLLERERRGSNSSLNSTASDDSGRFGSSHDSSKRTTLLHSFSTSDATIGEYKYTVTIGEDTLKITGTNPELVTIAKLVLDEYFMSESNDQFVECGLEEGTNFFDRPYLAENVEDILKASSTLSKIISNKDLGSFDTSIVKTFETDKLSFKEGSPEKSALESHNGDLLRKKTVRYSEDFSNKKTDITITLPLKTYSIEKLVSLADSPLSRRVPENWKNISKDFTAIVRRPPIEWFEAKTYLKEKLQETATPSQGEPLVGTSA